MAKNIALLRGVNVGGNTLKMERLRAICDELGFRGARTYMQSGNVVFDAPGATAALERALAAALAGELRLAPAVLVKRVREFGPVIEENPFLARVGIDPAKLHVTFLAGNAPRDAMERLEAINRPPVEFVVAGKLVYLYCPLGYGEIKLTNNAIEKALGLGATTRNWNTVNMLYAMARE